MSDYYIWLLNCVGMAQESQSDLLRLLFNTKFEYVLAMDENRASGGMNLREIYATENGLYLEDVYSGPCTVLEVLVALAIRMNEYESSHEASEWFLQMIDNLNLFDKSISDAENTLEIWMTRQYNADGSNGNIYYIPNYEGDMRSLEIWNQMHAYILYKQPNYSI